VLLAFSALFASPATAFSVFDDRSAWEAAVAGATIVGMYGSISNTWTFPEPVIGFGADWSAVLSYTDFTVIGDFDGTGPQSLNISAAIGGRYVPQFLGIVGLSDFDEVRFVSSETQNYFADHLSFAVAGAPIPEPTAALCFAVGFVGLSAGLQRPHGTTD
jgi:hypothetical protein